MRFSAPGSGKRAFGALACVAVLAVAGCGGDDTEEPAGGGGGGDGGSLPAEINLGMLDTMSGVAAFCGEQERQGAELAVEEINEQGFLGESKITLTVEDDKGTPEAGVAAFRGFVDDEVAAVVGPCLGTVAPATGPLAEQNQMPNVITTASGADVAPEFVFRAGIPQQEYAGNVIEVVEAEGAQRVAVLFDNAQPSIAQGSWGGAQKPAIEASGLELVVEEGVAGTNSDFSSQVSKAVRANPDAIGLLFQGAPNLTIAKQLREAGFEGQIWGQQGMLNDFYIKGGPAVEGTMISVSYSPALEQGSTSEFTEAFKAKYDINPSELSAHGYDAVWFAARAIKEAGSLEGPAIQQAMANINEMPGAQGDLTFTDEGDARGSGGVVKIENGELVGVEVPE